ncbi:MAG: LysM peptidoglycan-binding domain-containing protein [Anaerolineae bacterium]
MRRAVLLTLILALTVVSTARAEPTRQTTNHTVAWGETLYRISVRYNVTMDAIIAANGLANPDRLYAGQVLVIPDGSTTPEPSPAAAAAPAAGMHTVQPGETLFKISQIYGVPVSMLAQRNNLANPSRIYAGQQLVIDAAGVPTDPAPAARPAPPSTNAQGKLIVVDLSEQAVYAYENGALLRSFTVSTGLPVTPTVTGDYQIYLKYDSQWMSGPGYSLPGVPWVMYFYRGYGFHGTYWHSNFGQPMSHGCVNMRTDEAYWLYQWAPIGTAVQVRW